MIPAHDGRAAPEDDETAATVVERSVTVQESTRRVRFEPLRIGEVIGGRYRVIRHVARGGFGEVYEAEDERTAMRIALKLHRTGGVVPGALDALRGEFALLASLRHPNLASVHDFGYVGSAAYFTQDLVQGVRLDHAGVDIGSARGIALVGQLARALDYLHARGILHRDVKPSNVLVDASAETLVLLDFGIARALGERSHDGMLVGSFAYMPPEAIRGQPLDPRSDLYSLGVTLYRIAAGRAPFESRGRDASELLLDHLHAPPPPLPSTVTPALANVIVRLLSKEPSDRFASAGDFMVALAEAAGLELPTDTPETLASYVLSARYVDDGRSLDRLEEAVDARSPVPALLLVGEAGTGKSRTVRELRHRLLLRGIPWVAVETPRDGGDSLLRDVADAAIDRSVLSGLDEVDRIELARGLPRLRRPRERIAVAVDPERAKALRIEALARALALRFGEGPGVLCVDDLHRAAPATVAGLAHLVRSLSEAGAQGTVIVTGRPGPEMDALADAVATRDVAARPLDPPRCRELVASTLGDGSILDATALGRALSEGSHPALWVQESLRLAIDTGALVRRLGRWTVVKELDPMPLEEVLTWRLLALTADARRLALAAGVLGQPATVADLARVAGRVVSAAATALAELVRAGIAEERPTSGGHLTYAIHDRYRDVTPSLLSRADVRRAHAGAARMMLQHKGDARQLERAAQHLALAGHVRGAARCLLEASNAAERGGRPDVALRLLEDALRTGAPATIRDHLRRFDLAMTAAARTAVDESLAFLVRATRSASAAERVEIRLRRARRAAQESRPDEVTRQLEAARRDAVKLGRDDLIVRAIAQKGEAERYFGSFEACAATYTRAAELAHRIGDKSEEANAWLGASFAHLHLGRVDLGEAAAQRAVRAAGAVDPAARSDALRHLGNVLRETEQSRRAAATYRRAVAAARSAGCLEREAKALNNLGTVALRNGDLEEAQLAYERSIHLKQRAGARASVLVGHNNLGALLLVMGDFEGARRVLEPILTADSTDALHVSSAAHANLADLDLLQGDIDRAISRYERTLSSCRARGLKTELPHGLSGLMRALVMRGGRDAIAQARAHADELASLAEELGVASAKRRAHVARAILLDVEGRPADGIAHARAAVEAESLRFHDVVATPLEARWILALLLARSNERAAAERAAAAAARALGRLARCLRSPARRERFLGTHPVHAAITATDLSIPPGHTWRAAAAAG